MNAQQRALAMFKHKYEREIIMGVRPLRGRLCKDKAHGHILKFGKKVTFMLSMLRRYEIPYCIKMHSTFSYRDATLEFPSDVS